MDSRLIIYDTNCYGEQTIWSSFYEKYSNTRWQQPEIPSYWVRTNMVYNRLNIVNFQWLILSTDDVICYLCKTYVSLIFLDPDTGKIDRLRALSWFGGWWCMVERFVWLILITNEFLAFKLIQKLREKFTLSINKLISC